MVNTENYGELNMKNKQLVLEHSEMMFFSKELIQMQVPYEINMMFFAILILFIGLIIGLLTVKINDVKRVSGVVKTLENNSLVRNVLPGEIDTICFKPEQYVQKGEILYSLNKDSYRAIKTKLDNEISNLEDKIVCMNMLIEGFYSGKNHLSKEENFMIYSQLEEYFSTVAYFENQIEILEYRTSREKNKPKPLFEQQDYEEACLSKQLSQKELEKYKASFLADVSRQKTEYEAQVEKLKQEKIRNEKDYSFLDVKAPISGYVQECSSLNVGDYVFADQSIVNIVPSKEAQFRVELAIGSKDIGEIRPGMTVKYRLSAFPFYEYKGAEGCICSIDSDVRTKSDGRFFYRIYADIDKVTFTNSKNEVFPLRAGIEVNAVIVMEKVRLIEFILRKLDFMQ